MSNSTISLDQRHDGDGIYPMPQGGIRFVDTTMSATDLVFVTPLYWYSFTDFGKTVFRSLVGLDAG